MGIKKTLSIVLGTIYVAITAVAMVGIADASGEIFLSFIGFMVLAPISITSGCMVGNFIGDCIGE